MTLSSVERRLIDELRKLGGAMKPGRQCSVEVVAGDGLVAKVAIKISKRASPAEIRQYRSMIIEYLSRRGITERPVCWAEVQEGVLKGKHVRCQRAAVAVVVTNHFASSLTWLGVAGPRFVCRRHVENNGINQEVIAAIVRLKAKDISHALAVGAEKRKATEAERVAQHVVDDAPCTGCQASTQGASS